MLILEKNSCDSENIFGHEALLNQNSASSQNTNNKKALKVKKAVAGIIKVEKKNIEDIIRKELSGKIIVDLTLKVKESGEKIRICANRKFKSTSKENDCFNGDIGDNLNGNVMLGYSISNELMHKVYLSLNKLGINCAGIFFKPTHGISPYNIPVNM